jgi:hypothetical protein
MLRNTATSTLNAAAKQADATAMTPRAAFRKRK